MTRREPIQIERGERDPRERYVIYAQRGGQLHELASTPTPQGIGVALTELHEDCKRADRRLSDEGVIGVRDSHLGEWIVFPFPRPGS